MHSLWRKWCEYRNTGCEGRDQEDIQFNHGLNIEYRIFNSRAIDPGGDDFLDHSGT